MNHQVHSFMIFVLILSLPAAIVTDAPEHGPAELKPCHAQTVDTKVTLKTLKLRTGPGIDYPILYTIPEGTTLHQLSSASGWTLVSFNNTTGFVVSNFLTTLDDCSTLYLVKERVNMRSGPEMYYPVLMKIPEEAIVAVQSISGDWARLVYNDITGFIHTSFLTRSFQYTTVRSTDLHSGPGHDYRTRTAIPSGASIEVFSISDSWGRGAYQNRLNFIPMTDLNRIVTGNTDKGISTVPSPTRMSLSP